MPAAAGAGNGQGANPRERAREFAEQTPAKSRFTGYETEEQQTTVAALAQEKRPEARRPAIAGEAPGGHAIW